MKAMDSRCVEPEIEKLCIDSIGINFDDYKSRLNLACGADYKEGWVNVDSDHKVKADYYCNLEDNLPFKPNTFDFVYASHIFEHIHKLQELKECIHRVLKPEGVLVSIVPHYLSDDAWGNPTHCRAFSLDSFRISQFWPGDWEPDINLGYLRGGNPQNRSNDGYHFEWIICKRIKAKERME